MARHNDTGNWGENIAREYLITKGYTIIGTNVLLGKNELDIVARYNDRIVFVEVKTRSTDEYDPLDAVDRKKISHLCRGAEAYVSTHNIPHPVQFDIIIVIGKPGNTPAIEHLPDAIMPPLSTR